MGVTDYYPPELCRTRFRHAAKADAAWRSGFAYRLFGVFNKLGDRLGLHESS